MKKNALKIAVFLFGFIIGAGSVSMPGFFAKRADFPASAEIEPVFETAPVAEKRRGTGLVLKFREIVDTGYGLAADFEVTNFESESYFYRSSQQISPSEIVFAPYGMKIDGKEETFGRCANGLNVFELKPDESKIFRVPVSVSDWRRGKSLRFGFDFNKTREASYRTFWSEELAVEALIAESLSKVNARPK